MAVSFGLGTLWLHPALERPLFVGLAITLLWPALALPSPVPWPRWRLAWSAVLALALGVGTAAWALMPSERLLALTALIAVVELRWAYNPTGARRARLMVALAMLPVVLTSQATESALFALLAAPFALCALGTLMWGEIGLNLERVGAPITAGFMPVTRVSRWRRMWARPVALTVISAGLAFALFTLFPRFGWGERTGAATSINSDFALTGMSDHVELGSFDTLLRDPAPAVHLTWIRGSTSAPLYLRGGALPELRRQGEQWQWGRMRAIEASRECETDVPTPLTGEEIPAGALVQRVELRDPALVTVFSLPWLMGVEGPGGLLEREQGDRWRFPQTDQVWRVYTAFASGRAWSAPEIAAQERETCLELPDDLRNRTRRFLIEQANISTLDQVEQIAQAIIYHLRAAHTHSLDLREIRRGNALEDFMFGRRAGHCEHFASAMTVMCRAVDIPARLVTGFHGGERLSDDEVLFRRSHAHAWVEIWVDGRGWVLMDPTPPDPLALETDVGLWSSLSGVVGEVGGTWREKVVHYQGIWHRRALSWAGRWTDRILAKGVETGMVGRQAEKMRVNLTEEPSLRYLIAGIILLNALIFWLDRRWRRFGVPWRRGRPATAQEALVQRLAHALDRRPRPRSPGETAAEYLLSLLPTDRAAEGHHLVNRFYDWRYAPPCEDLTAQDLVTQAHRIRAAGS